MDFKVSIITVVRNGQDTLQALIDSVAAFKTDDTEFIIWDGLSGDRTLEIIEQNQGVITRFTSQQDNGIYDAMNKAIALANGKWLLFLGCDDLLMEGYTHMLPLLNEPKCIYYGGVLFGEETASTRFTKYMLTRRNICHQAIFYPAEIFRSYTYDTQYTACADYYLNVQLWNNRNYSTRFYDLIIAKYALTGHSSTIADKAYERDRDSWFRDFMPKLVFLRYLNRKMGTFKLIGHLLRGSGSV